MGRSIAPRLPWSRHAQGWLPPETGAHADQFDPSPRALAACRTRVFTLAGAGDFGARYLWRAVDHDGEVLEAVVTAKREKAAALKFLKRIMKKYGRPLSVVTDGLCSYPAAMKEIGNADRQEAGRRLNNRAENSHQPFRRRERAMQRFRSMKTLQIFSSVHAQVHNHFNQERHLITRQVYKQRRSEQRPAHAEAATPATASCQRQQSGIVRRCVIEGISKERGSAFEATRAVPALVE